MTKTLRFETMPGIATSYARALIGRRPGLREGATLPHIEAELAPILADAEMLKKYVDLCGFSGRETLPPTYLHVLAVPLHIAMLTDSSFPLATMGIVHVSQRIEQYAAIPADAKVALRCELQGHKPARKGITFDLITEGRVDGELCWRGTTTVLSRSKVGRGDPPKPDTEPVIPARELEVTRWGVAENLGRRYASIAKDRNPIHLHALAAKAFGFKRAIIHGMWTMAKAVAALEDSWPSGAAVFTCSFKRPIFLPSSVEFVHAPHPDGGEAYAVWRPGTDKLHLYGKIAPLDAS